MNDWMRAVVEGVIELAAFIVVNLWAWAKFSQKIQDEINVLQEWKETHEVDASNRDGEITDLRIKTARQEEKMDAILRTVESIDKKLENFRERREAPRREQ